MQNSGPGLWVQSSLAWYQNADHSPQDPRSPAGAGGTLETQSQSGALPQRGCEYPSAQGGHGGWDGRALPPWGLLSILPWGVPPPPVSSFRSIGLGCSVFAVVGGVCGQRPPPSPRGPPGLSQQRQAQSPGPGGCEDQEQGPRGTEGPGWGQQGGEGAVIVGQRPGNMGSGPPWWAVPCCVLGCLTGSLWEPQPPGCTG